MTPDTFEQQIGEQGYGRGIYYLQAFHPFGGIPRPAVRGKHMAISCVCVTVYGFRTEPVGIGQRAAPNLEGDAYVGQLSDKMTTFAYGLLCLFGHCKVNY